MRLNDQNAAFSFLALSTLLCTTPRYTALRATTFFFGKKKQPIAALLYATRRTTMPHNASQRCASLERKDEMSRSRRSSFVNTPPREHPKVYVLKRTMDNKLFSHARWLDERSRNVTTFNTYDSAANFIRIHRMHDVVVQRHQPPMEPDQAVESCSHDQTD